MELALQVVGLKMTGKIEDAKDIAMRIVGSSSNETQQQTQHMAVSQMVSLATCSAGAMESRRIVLSRTDDAGFEKLIMDSLSVLDSADGPTSSSAATIISHRNPTGQTMLHLAAFLNFPSLVEFLIQREIDLDVQDNNGCTALHFAALSRSQCCARLLVNAGADTLIADEIGRTAIELAPTGLFDPLLTRSPLYTEASGSESDEESQWGDVEEDSGDEDSVPVRSTNQARVLSKRRLRLPRSRRSSRAASAVQSDISDNEAEVEQPDAADVDFDDGATVVSPETDVGDHEKASPSIDEEKRAAAASFAEYIQRAWAQFQPGQRMPQMLHMPQLPGMPAWVYPIFVPMPAWRPPFRIEKSKNAANDGHKTVDGAEAIEEVVEVAGSGQKVRPPTGTGKDSSVEWRASWEKWTAQMNGAMSDQGQFAGAASGPGTGVVDHLPFEARVADDHPRGEVTAAAAVNMQTAPPAHVPNRSLLRRFGYGRVQIAEKDASAPSHRRRRVTRLVKKEDRMLVFFWIPILIRAYLKFIHSDLQALI